MTVGCDSSNHQHDHRLGRAEATGELQTRDLDSVDLNYEFFASSLVVAARKCRFKAIGRMRVGIIAVIFTRLGNERTIHHQHEARIGRRTEACVAKARLEHLGPGQGFAEADWEAVSDNAEWTADEIEAAQPFAAVFPELAERMKRSRGRPLADSRKQQVTLRLDSDLLERFRATGPGWQSRMNEALRKAVGL